MSYFGGILPRLSDISAQPVDLPPDIITPGGQVTQKNGTLGVIPTVSDDDNPIGSFLSQINPFNSPTQSTSSGTTSATQNASTSQSTSNSATSTSASTSASTTPPASSATSSASSGAPSQSSTSSSSVSTSGSASAPGSSATSSPDSQTTPPSSAAPASATNAPDQSAPTQSSAGAQSSPPGSVTAATTGSAPDSTNSVAGAITQPKGFLENKPLSISVIVIGSLVALILLFIIGTWALRKRRNSRLDDFAADLSTDNLVGSSSLFHGDIEKHGGGFGGSSGSDDVLEKVEAIGGARNDGGRYAVGRSASSGGASRAGPVQRAAVPRVETYEQTGYPAVPVFVPQQAYGGTQASQDYGYNQTYGQTQGYGQRQQYYAQAQLPYGYAQGPAGYEYEQNPGVYQQQSQAGSRLPNPFDSSEPALQVPPPAFDLARGAYPGSTQEFMGANASRGVQRKPPPALLTLNIPPTPPAPASAVSTDEAYTAVSLGGSPTRIADPMNAGKPPPEYPSPTTPVGGRRAERTKTLDHTLPPISVTPPLPSELSLSLKSTTPRRQQFKVVNI